MEAKDHILLPYHKPSEAEILQRSEALLTCMKSRRSVRYFSDESVPKEIIRQLLKIAASAPSGANKQPWHFVAVSDPNLKKEIREAAEKEEYLNYHGRMSDEWLKDLKIFDTNWQKPFLETAPWLIIVFKKPYDLDGEQQAKNYYVSESVGIASGFLISAIHQVGLVTLTHTPSPMNFLERLLDRPKNEKAFLLLPVGYPSQDCLVPNIQRKGEEDVISFLE